MADGTIVVGNCTIELLRGDITRIAADAIVTAANSALAGGGGVDGAVHDAAGPTLMQELSKYDGCPTGSAVVTGAGHLPARYVLHAVGPIYQDGKHGEADLLAACKTALQLADDKHCTSISFPSISTGVYGYPIAEAANVALQSITNTVPKLSSVRFIKLVQFNEASYNAYRQLMYNFARARGAGQTS